MPSMPKKVYGFAPQKQNKQAEQKNWLKDKEHEKFYNSKAWRHLSLSYKMKHPVCEVEGCNQPSYYTDHIIPMSQGGDEWNEDNFQALCKSCNGSKTAKQSSNSIAIQRMLK